MNRFSDRAWYTLVLAVAATIAEIDDYSGPPLTSEAVLQRIDWWLQDPYTHIPALLLEDEAALRVIQQRLRDDVLRYKANFSSDPPT